MHRSLARLSLALAIWAAPVAAATAQSAQDADTYQIRSQVAEFFAIVARHDIARMEALWQHAPDVAMMTPSQRRPAIGWSAVRAAFESGTFTFWRRFDAAPTDYPLVVFDGDVANALFLVRGVGRNRWGVSVPYLIHVSQRFRKAGDAWLMVGSFAEGGPQ